MAWPLLRPRHIPILLWYAHGHTPFIVRVAERLVDRVLTSTAGGFRLPSSKLQIIGQGINTDRFVPRQTPRNASDDDFRLITVGRLSHIKRLDVVIDALGHLTARAADGRRITGVLIGGPLSEADRDYETELRQRAQEVGVSERVEFVGAASFETVHAWYWDADVCVNSSETGSADKAVLEAMSVGLPVVTSNEAFAQLLPFGLHGECLVPGADPHALARRVAQIAAMEVDTRRALGLRLRKVVVEGHSLHRLAARIVEEARALVKSHASTLKD
jgi:glycosyltransferase involved in cell wall biosynthesis